ncbi:MAG: sialidase family protein [Planctomycetaceae bacterium]
MKSLSLPILTLLLLSILNVANSAEPAPPTTAVTEGDLSEFLGDERHESQELYSDERFPNIVVGTDGTVLATWGQKRFRVRRSEDGGRTWGPEIFISEGIHAGGAVVNERTGDVLAFVHPQHPPLNGETAPRTMFRSQDQGRTWTVVEADFPADVNGYVPSLHMCEHGITLRHGKHSGRLVRPARIYRTSPDRYSSAIFSDDGGKRWQPSGPVPIQGSGEGALLELSDGRLIYSARRSYFADGQPLLWQRHFAVSSDGGESWQPTSTSKVLPDGPAYRGDDKRGSNYNGHFGMMAGFIRLPIAHRDILLYSNADHDGHERVRLTVWASFDGGKTWPVKRLVNEGPSAYSSLAAGRHGTAGEGWIYLQYEYGEGKKTYIGGRICRFNLSWLLSGIPTGDGTIPVDLK